MSSGRLIAFAFVLGIVVWIALPFFGPYTVSQWIGPVQVLGGPDEVWVFVERSILARIPGRNPSKPVRPAGHYQEIVVFDASGEKQRIQVASMGPTFDQNIGRIFRRPDGFYLLHTESRDYYPSLFRWSKDHFDLLPLEDSQALLKEAGLTDATPEQIGSRLNRMTEASGWKYLFDPKVSWVNGEAFTWKQFHFRFDTEDGGSFVKTRLVSTEQSPPLAVMTASFDTTTHEITRREYDSISSFREPGHRKTPR